MAWRTQRSSDFSWLQYIRGYSNLEVLKCIKYFCMTKNLLVIFYLKFGNRLLVSEFCLENKNICIIQFELIFHAAVGGMGSLSSSWVKSQQPDNALSCCEVYDPLSNTWQAAPPLPRALAAPGIFKYMGTIYVMGELQLRVICILNIYVYLFKHNKDFSECRTSQLII